MSPGNQPGNSLPFLKCLHNAADVLPLDVPANAEVHLQHLVTLIQLPLDDVCVNGFND